MAAIDNVNLTGGNILFVGFRLGGIERGFILAPEDEQGRLVLPHPGLPLGVRIHIGPVVIEEVGLNVQLAGLVEEVEFVGPKVRVVALGLWIAASMAAAGSREGKEIDA